MTPGEAPALILGAGSDIARALAERLAGRGHPLMLAAREPAKIERDRADLAARYGVEVTAHRYDAREPGGIDGVLDALPRSPRIAVCAVGYMPEQEASAADPALAERVIATNFTGPALTLEALARRMAAEDADTAIVAIASVAGDRGRARNYVYGAAKAGFATWLSGMRQKYARTRLHVMTVKPGFVATAMTEGMDLPGALTTDPGPLADRILRGLDRRRQVHYDLAWRGIMTVIALIPERIFMKLRF